MYRKYNIGTIKKVIKELKEGKIKTYLVINFDCRIDDDNQIIKIKKSNKGDGVFIEVNSSERYSTNITNMDFFIKKKCYFVIKENKNNKNREIIEIGIVDEE